MLRHFVSYWSPHSIMLSIVLLACGTSFAQVNVPFQVTTSSGELDRFPVFPDDVGGPGILHDIDVGGATIDGQALSYTSLGSIRVLEKSGMISDGRFDYDGLDVLRFVAEAAKRR